MPTIEIQASDLGNRLDVFLSEFLQSPRSHIQKLIKQGDVTVNDQPAKPKTVLTLGDHIAYPDMNPSAQVKTEIAPELDIVYEDDDLLVINKPAGLLVHETLQAEFRATLVDALLKRYPEMVSVGDDPKRPGIVHRLDKSVSGLMCVAKTQDAFLHLKRQFQNRTVKKEYFALVYGSVPKDTDTITQKIARSKQKGRMVSRTGEQDGKDAITQYDVISRYATATFLNIRIFTGRTHQIRVHMQGIGYPLVGDKLYKIKKMKFREIELDRIFLHSHNLTIELMNGETTSFESPLPQDLQAILERLPTNPHV